MAWKTWPPKATKWEYNKKTKMVYMYHVIHLNGSHFRKGQKLWTQFPKVFHIYIYIYIYLCDMDARGFMISRRSQTHTADRKKGLFVYICVKFTGIWEQPLSFVHFRPTSWQVICLQMGRTDIGFTVSLHLWAQRPADNGRQWAQQGSKGTSPHVRRAWFQTHTLW